MQIDCCLARSLFLLFARGLRRTFSEMVFDACGSVVLCGYVGNVVQRICKVLYGLFEADTLWW